MIEKVHKIEKVRIRLRITTYTILRRIKNIKTCIKYIFNIIIFKFIYK